MKNQAEIGKRMTLFTIVTMFVTVVLITPQSNASCLNTAEMQSRLQESMDGKCGKGIKWDLSEYVPDDSICDSRKQGLNLIQQVFEATCRDEKSSSELRSKVSAIKVKAHLGEDARYVLSGKTLNATVPIKEVPVLTKWTEHQAQLRAFIRKSTGLAFMSHEEAEVAEREARSKAQKEDADKAKRQREKEASDREAATRKRDAERETQRIAREKKIADLNGRLKKAADEFQKTSQAIWARPGSTPEDNEKKQKDHAEALEKFNRAQAEFTSEVQNIK